MSKEFHYYQRLKCPLCLSVSPPTRRSCPVFTSPPLLDSSVSHAECFNSLSLSPFLSLSLSLISPNPVACLAEQDVGSHGNSENRVYSSSSFHFPGRSASSCAERPRNSKQGKNVNMSVISAEDKSTPPCLVTGDKVVTSTAAPRA